MSPRVSAPVWGAVFAVALIAVFSLGIALSRSRPTVVTVPVASLPPAAMSGAVAGAVPAAPPPPGGAVAPPVAVTEPRPERNFDELLERGEQALDQGRFVEAAELARRVLAEELNQPRATALLTEATTRERERERSDDR